MKEVLIKIFSPILSVFENQDGPYEYKPSHRLILKVAGVLFLLLSLAAAAACVLSKQLGALLPVVVFFALGLVCQVVGFLGSDKAVAKLWNSR